jgi:hypothetical protein
MQGADTIDEHFSDYSMINILWAIMSATLVTPLLLFLLLLYPMLQWRITWGHHLYREIMALGMSSSCLHPHSFNTCTYQSLQAASCLHVLG